VTGSTRSVQLPEVPTVAESGVPGFSYTAWGGFFGPSRLPERLVTTLQDAFAKTIKEPDFLQFIAANGSQISQPESVVDFQAFLRDAIVRETAVMNRLGLKAG
jgi:tripartite-type tricarboxylate transporter receptor subunit TctC